jgi:hypothetical protein
VKKLFLFTAIFISYFAYAQSDSLSVAYDTKEIVEKRFNQDNLESYKSNPDFDYTEATAANDHFFQQVFEWFYRLFLKFLSWLFGVEKATGILEFILSVLPYIAILVILFLIIKFFLKVKTNPFSNTAINKSIVSISEEEELIKHKDLPALIKKAIENKNYRLAVRYLYINALKLLEEGKIIIWEQQKTNEDYIKEIKSEFLKESFKEVTHLYDFVWYGNFDINEVEFFKVEENFKKTNQLIQKEVE